jgi:hypothetical protein
MATTTFSFTGLNGEIFEVSAPAGTDEASARAEFEKQLNSGSLSNIPVGGTLESLTNAGKDLLAKTASLIDLPVNLPITPADILKMAPASLPIGSLDVKQVTGLLGQAATAAGQAADAVSSAGIGKFAIGPEQLESQGLLKPGTYENFFKNNAGANIADILNSPTVWSGKTGVSSLGSFLSNPSLQNITQQGVLGAGLAQLKSLGAVTGAENPQVLAGMLQSATKFAPADVAAWAKGLAPADITAQISNLAKDSQFSVNVVDQLPDVTGFKAEGVVGTVNRAGVDSAVKDFVSDPKVPAVKYGPVTRQADAVDPNESVRAQFNKIADELLNLIKTTYDTLSDINDAVVALRNQDSITQAEWNDVNNKFQTTRTKFNSENNILINKLYDILDKTSGDLRKDLQAIYNAIDKSRKLVGQYGAQLKISIAELESKIQ